MKVQIEKLLSILLPNLTGFVFGLFFIVAIGFGPRMMNIDGDLGRHLTIGEYILSQRVIPTIDIFSHTKFGDPITPHEWLSQLIFAISYRLAGFNGVILLSAILIGCAYAWVYHFSMRKSGSPLSALIVVILVAAAGSLHWLTRPHLFTILFLIIWYNLLDRVYSGATSAWWLLPITMLAWVNLHGAFIAGFVLCAGFIVGVFWEGWLAKSISLADSRKRLIRLLLAGFISLLVTLLNPVGWRIWETSLGYLQNNYLVSHTAEYLPPDFHQISTWPFLLLICLSLLFMGLARPQFPGYMPILVAGWTGMALISTRNIPLYAIIVAPALAISIQAFEPIKLLKPFFRLDYQIAITEKMIKGWLFPILVIGVTYLLFMSGIKLDFGRYGNQFYPTTFPLEAVDWLEAHPQEGNMFNYFPWGGYLLFRLWPQELVFIDGQTDFYGEDLTRVYEAILTSQNGWDKNLVDYGVEWIVFPSGEPFVQNAIATSEWQPIYKDAVTVILRRIQP